MVLRVMAGAVLQMWRQLENLERPRLPESILSSTSYKARYHLQLQTKIEIVITYPLPMNLIQYLTSDYVRRRVQTDKGVETSLRYSY